MAISLDKFDFLEAKYGGCSSWAIWKESSPKDATIVRQNLDRLNSAVIMVGLNASKPTPEPWSNYRVGKNDYKLIFAFNKGEYLGSYMTDLIKGHYDVDSKDIHKKIRSGEIDVIKQTRDFEEEMADVGADRESLFILFGGRVHQHFKKYLSHKFPRFAHCRHFSDRVSKEAWAEETFQRLAEFS